MGFLLALLIVLGEVILKSSLSWVEVYRRLVGFPE